MDIPWSDTWCAFPEVDEDTGSAPDDAAHGLAPTSSFWPPNSTVTYGFLSPPKTDVDRLKTVTAYRMGRVDDALAYYMGSVSLKFKFIDTSSLDFNKQDDRKKCNIRISFGAPFDDAGSTTLGWSYRGTGALMAPEFAKGLVNCPAQPWSTLYLGDQPVDATDEKLLATRGDRLKDALSTLYHELGHALGLAHEHDSPDPNSPLEGGGIAKYLIATLVCLLGPHLYTH